MRAAESVALIINCQCSITRVIACRAFISAPSRASGTNRDDRGEWNTAQAIACQKVKAAPAAANITCGKNDRTRLELPLAT